MPPYVVVPMPNKQDSTIWTSVTLPLDFLMLPRSINWVWDPVTQHVYNRDDGVELDIVIMADSVSKLGC